MARDLAAENGELGGRLVFDSQGSLRFEAVGSPGGNDNAYEMGPSLNPFEAALGFHNHATGRGHHAEHAGPSTAYQGTGADLGAAYTRHLDRVVLTPVGRGRVDVDFYTTRGTVVDLGVFDAPW